MFLRFLVPALPLAFPLTAQSQVFRVDDNHTVLGFKASTLLFDVPGRFTRLDRLDFGVGAESVAAKISLKRQVELDLLLVGFFEVPPAPTHPASTPAKKPAASAKK